jgi:hypothetical protein
MRKTGFSLGLHEIRQKMAKTIVIKMASLRFINISIPCLKNIPPRIYRREGISGFNQFS